MPTEEKSYVGIRLFKAITSLKKGAKPLLKIIFKWADLYDNDDR
jgi:hypothetical protein